MEERKRNSWWPTEHFLDLQGSPNDKDRDVGMKMNFGIGLGHGHDFNGHGLGYRDRDGIWGLGGGKEARNGWLLWPREHFRHLPDTGCTARLSSPSVKSRSTLTQEISPASGLQPR